MRAIRLLGRDYPELGPVGVEALDGGGALALSRGRFKKPYRHQDPNEDGALLVRSDAGVLLAVSDGYNGVAASETALELAAARAGVLIASSGQEFRSAVLELFDDVGERLRTARRSRTCLVLASVTDDGCLWASFGDSSLFRSDAEGPVTKSNRLVLGSGLSLDAAEESWSGSFAPVGGERIALVTDGITNFTPRPSEIPRTLGEAEDDVGAARALVDAALLGGAGDNVAVATLAVGTRS